MAKILVAESQMIFRLGVMALIKKVADNNEIHEALNKAAIYSSLRNHQYDTLIVNTLLPGPGNILTLIQKVKISHPEIRIMVFCEDKDIIESLMILQAGASGVISHQEDEQTIELAIQTILKKRVYMSDRLMRFLLSGKKVTPESLTPKAICNTIPGLTYKERQVLDLLLKGHTMQDIKSMLRIKPSTLSTHKQRVFTKLNVRSIVELFNKYRIEGFNT